MKSNYYSELSKDFSSILNDSDKTDVIIQVGKNEDTEEFRAHSIILRARSQYFEKAFSSRWVTKKDDMFTFNKPNITPVDFDIILKYIYSGEVDLTKKTGENIFGLLIASDELLIKELFNHAQDYLIEEKTTWIQENYNLIFDTVYKFMNCKKLQDYCLESICSNPQSFNVNLLDEKIIHNLLEQDDLQVEEIDVWNLLIKWGIKQTPGLNKNSDITKWNNENYEALKKTLDGFIPLIRFVGISHNDYFDKVRPYKAIIPNQIYEEIEEFYIKCTLPNTTNLAPRGMIQSKIIKQKLSNIIITWINRKNLNSFYKFNLIYRLSRDRNIFNVRDKCIKQGGPVLILIKTKNLDKVFGGYSPLMLSSVSTTESFIFSFENSEDTKNMKISRVIDPSNAITSGWGRWGKWQKEEINFGDCNLQLTDIYLHLSNNDKYEVLCNSKYKDETYEIDEIEAFSVVEI
ncbi:hypothetical protein C1645_742706 [Glomus cerebriforme]|uniref:BTB/POZ domain-containing protein n=1 Tax=Glomus cerebriforme TaxID=658196 RepID=A0A397SM99_9GLOM|nr:hypothetical protein C1645_742706 [Glomus cerebriforme]